MSCDNAIAACEGFQSILKNTCFIIGFNPNFDEITRADAQILRFTEGGYHRQFGRNGAIAVVEIFKNLCKYAALCIRFIAHCERFTLTNSRIQRFKRRCMDRQIRCNNTIAARKRANCIAVSACAAIHFRPYFQGIAITKCDVLRIGYRILYA